MGHKSDTPDAHRDEIASRRHGVATVRQLGTVGLTRYGVAKRAERGRLLRVHQGVYAVGHRGLSLHGRCKAAVLACGEGAVLSHVSAAVLWKLLEPTDGPVNVSRSQRVVVETDFWAYHRGSVAFYADSERAVELRSQDYDVLRHRPGAGGGAGAGAAGPRGLTKKFKNPVRPHPTHECGSSSLRDPMAFRLALALTLLGLLACPALAAADEAEPLFDPAAVAEIDFILPPASLQKLEEEPETDQYQHAAITVKAGGQTYELADVGFRLKGGHGSFRELTGKAAFKVKFKEFDGPKLLGLKKPTLNNMVQDPSMVHETLVYELFRGMGVPAPRTGYAFVRINGEPYGVYLNVETYDDVMLPRLFPSTRHLFEADAPGVDVRTGEADTFEVDEGDDSEGDLGDLEALIAAADNTVGDWSDGMEAVADLTEMTRMWAVERYAAHWDGYAGTVAPFRPNNYYLHSDEAGVFAMLPWGTDQTWEGVREVEFDEPAGGLLFNNCLADVSCETLYEAGLEEVAAKIPDLELDQAAICAADLLAPWQEQEDPLRAEYGAEEIAEGVADTRSFISLRPNELADYLGLEPPSEVPDGTDPCASPEPEPEAEPDSPLVTSLVQMPPATEQGGKASFPRLGSISRKGKHLRVNFFSPVGGPLVLSAKARGHRVCGREVVVGTGRGAASCRLTRDAVAALEEGPLRVGVKVRFSGVDRSNTSLSRRIRLART